MNQSSKSNPKLTNWKNALLLLLIVGLLGYQWYQSRKAEKQEKVAAVNEKVNEKASKVEDDKYAVKFKPPVNNKNKETFESLEIDDATAAVDDQKANESVASKNDKVAKSSSVNNSNSKTNSNIGKSSSNSKTGSNDKTNSNDRTSSNDKTNSGNKTNSNQSKEKPATAADDGSFLKPAGGKNLKSPAGLIYGMGPRGEHRVDHVMRHGKDDTSRPSHGVFVGDKDKILKNIDEAYELVKKKSNKVQTEESDGNTAYTVSMGRKVGYEGGEKGKRNGNRGLNSIRLILDGDRVITAYPYR